MWKWLGGCAAIVVILVIAFGVWIHGKYQSFTAEGGSTTVSIHAPPARVFAALANADSLSLWSGDRTVITATRHGPLQVGDTVFTQTESANGAPRQEFTRTVTEVQRDRLLVVSISGDRPGRLFAARRDSLVVSGDSTKIISTVALIARDSIRAAIHDTGGATKTAVIDIGAKLMVSVFRLQSETELTRLKAHLEGTAGPAAKR